MIIPQKQDLYIYQGATFDQTWEFIDSTTSSSIDFTNKTAKLSMKLSYEHTTSIHTITTDISASNGHIELINEVIGVSNSQYRIVIPADITADFPYTLERNTPKKVMIYDLKLIDINGEIDRMVYGAITVSPEVTTL